jgi:hypothetical protein
MNDFSGILSAVAHCDARADWSYSKAWLRRQ